MRHVRLLDSITARCLAWRALGQLVMHAEMLQLFETILERLVAGLQRSELHSDRRVLQLKLLAFNTQVPGRVLTICSFEAVASVLSFLFQVALQRRAHELDGAAQIFDKVRLVARDQDASVLVLHELLVGENIVPATATSMRNAAMNASGQKRAAKYGGQSER